MNCHLCDGEPIFLGILGNIVHFKCRRCGITYSLNIETLDEFELEELGLCHIA